MIRECKIRHFMSENALKGAKHAGQTARFIPISQNIATFASALRDPRAIEFKKRKRNMR